jgi:hypothetical protein
MNSRVAEFLTRNKMMAPFGDRLKAEVKSIYVPFQSTGAYSVGLGKRFYLPADPELSDGKAIIKGFDLVSSAMCSLTPAPAEQRDPLAANQMPRLSLVLMDRENREIAWIPFVDIFGFSQAGKILKTYIQDMSFENSFIDINTTAGISASNAVWIRVYYEIVK